MKSEDVNQLAKTIWDYHHMNHKLEKADCVLVLGSHDLRVAEYAARLFLEGWAPIIVFSGGIRSKSDLLKTDWNEPESEVFAKIALKMGIPKDRIIIENKATNTGENILFTKKILQGKNVDPKKIIVVQKPYMERRAYATFKKLWPEKEIILTSPPIEFERYPNIDIVKEDVINIIVGDLQRIKIYPRKGFQIFQEIPEDVWEAYKKLVTLGYTKHLLS
ncbi:MAG: YdcF family protein [Candidatus Hodarchaeota archaeon]